MHEDSESGTKGHSLSPYHSSASTDTYTRPAVLDEDILHLIFLSGSLDDPQYFPHVISLVCRSWRRLALSTTTLWTTVYFKGIRNITQSEERVRRSGTALLDIKIANVETKGHEGFLPDLEEIFTVLRPHSNRWRALVTPPNTSVRAYDVALRLRDVSAPNLETLSLCSEEYGATGYATIALDLLKGPTPRLKDLTIASLAIDPIRLHQSPGLHHISVDRHTFDGHYGHAASDIRAVLSGCPDLESLRVQDQTARIFRSVWKSHDSPLYPHATHDKLLRLMVADFRVMKALLSTVHLPKLAFVESLVYPEFFPLICQHDPFPKLEGITLGVGVVWDDIQDPDAYLPYLPALFATLPRLKTLEIRGYGFTDATWMRELGHLCPQLETLNMRRCRGISEEALKEMIDARIQSPGTQRLKLLVVVYCRAQGSSNNWLEWITSNVERVEPRGFREKGFLAATT